MYNQSILLPCTENVTPANMVSARNIIEAAIPPGYALTDLQPRVTTGRNPHRWVGSFTRNDNQYRADCQFLVVIKKDFKRYCPVGSEIRTVSICDDPNPNHKKIEVEFLVNCYCSKIVNRRRRRRWIDSNCYQYSYTTEQSTCVGT